MQKSLAQYYDRSDIKDQITSLATKENLDKAALEVVSRLASRGEGGWMATFPNLRPSGQGMDCTLATAMFHLALENLNYKGVRSALRMGHYVVTRFFEDGGLKVYDPATRITENEVTRGYSQIYGSNEVEVTEVKEEVGGKLIDVTLNRVPVPPVGFKEVGDGKYKLKLYAHPDGIYLDLSVALENLDSLRRDATVQGDDVWQRQARGIIERHSEIKDFDYQKLKRDIGFFDPHDLL